MTRKKDAEQADDLSRRLATVLLVIGFLVLFAGSVILSVAETCGHNSSAGFGATVFVGSFPFVVGVGSEVTWAVLVADVLVALNGIMLLVMHRKRKGKG